VNFIFEEKKCKGATYMFTLAC